MKDFEEHLTAKHQSIMSDDFTKTFEHFQRLLYGTDACLKGRGIYTNKSQTNNEPQESTYEKILKARRSRAQVSKQFCIQIITQSSISCCYVQDNTPILYYMLV